ncbi:MAG: hypothetical protein R8L07_05955 [Alphaproteobacteria bacterium]|nr:hypothetical protein [Alphaproteobacteria bacterium]
MAYTLHDLADDCREALKSGESPEALTQVRDFVRKALADPDFMAANLLNREPPPERDVIHEDPDLGFCICVHIYADAKPGSPHDHGSTWAIYGQGEGETEMTDWQVIRPAAGDRPALVEKTRTYTLKPGDAHIYPTGAVHAPIRYGATRLLRIEGTNTDRIQRTRIEVA